MNDIFKHVGIIKWWVTQLHVTKKLAWRKEIASFIACTCKSISVAYFQNKNI